MMGRYDSDGPAGRMALTDRQRQIYEFIRVRIENGRPPTVREIAKEFGIKGPNGACEHLRALIKKGWLKRTPDIARGLALAGVDAEKAQLLSRFAELPLERLKSIAKRLGLLEGMDRGQEEGVEKVEEKENGRGGRKSPADRTGATGRRSAGRTNARG